VESTLALFDDAPVRATNPQALVKVD